MIRLLPQLEPQQVRSPHHRLVSGPQSAIVTATQPPLHGLCTKNWWPQVRRARFSPHCSGWVIARHASDALGHAHWWEPDLQLPQLPPPAELHGPHAAPQQNHDISPDAAFVVEQAIVFVPSAWGLGEFVGHPGGRPSAAADIDQPRCRGTAAGIDIRYRPPFFWTSADVPGGSGIVIARWMRDSGKPAGSAPERVARIHQGMRYPFECASSSRGRQSASTCRTRPRSVRSAAYHPRYEVSHKATVPHGMTDILSAKISRVNTFVGGYFPTCGLARCGRGAAGRRISSHSMGLRRPVAPTFDAFHPVRLAC